VSAFQTAKRLAIAGLTVGMLMWLGAFLTFGSEWFLMWRRVNPEINYVFRTSSGWRPEYPHTCVNLVVGTVLIAVDMSGFTHQISRNSCNRSA
jgi:Predicted small integral membrane protein (DUF2165)